MKFLLLSLLLLPLTAPALAQMKYILQYEDQFSKWHRYQEKHNEGDAIRTAKARAKARAPEAIRNPAAVSTDRRCDLTINRGLLHVLEPSTSSLV